MAFGNFSLTTAKSTLITMLNTQLTAVGKLFKDQTSGDFTDQIRYNSALKRLEYWTGSAWAALDISATGIGAASIAAGTITATLAGNATSATSTTNASGTGTAVKSGSGNGLRVVHGRVSSTGSILSGSGFTTSKGGTGACTVTWSPVFSAVATVVVSGVQGNVLVAATSATPTSFTVYISVNTVGSDQDFNFIAIGPN